MRPLTKRQELEAIVEDPKRYTNVIDNPEYAEDLMDAHAKLNNG
jgi:hypothetical protein